MMGSAFGMQESELIQQLMCGLPWLRMLTNKEPLSVGPIELRWPDTPTEEVADWLRCMASLGVTGLRPPYEIASAKTKLVVNIGGPRKDGD